MLTATSGYGETEGGIGRWRWEIGRRRRGGGGGGGGGVGRRRGNEFAVGYEESSLIWLLFCSAVVEESLAIVDFVAQWQHRSC